MDNCRTTAELPLVAKWSAWGSFESNWQFSLAQLSWHHNTLGELVHWKQYNLSVTPAATACCKKLSCPCLVALAMLPSASGLKMTSHRQLYKFRPGSSFRTLCGGIKIYISEEELLGPRMPDCCLGFIEQKRWNVWVSSTPLLSGPWWPTKLLNLSLRHYWQMHRVICFDHNVTACQCTPQNKLCC